MRTLTEVHLDVISPSIAMFNVLVQQEASPLLFQSLKRIDFAGEKMNMKFLRRASSGQQQSEAGKFVNLYGPTTEATRCSL
jgi:hypothetical protein